ncbi:serine/threonine-protein kinase [Parahaliea mediterranea]|uniref:serine/threonine-protein kinase n=1 Tax=Parahaliea mediterranea TaxID=651086 RepID=UPI000E2F7927|nr:serine/threonine-protein kinase [Parahaliea mediterranea]
MDPDRLAQLFDETVALSTSAQREAVLEHLDKQDPAMAAELRALLAAHDASGDFLEDSALNEAAALVPDLLGSSLIGSSIGPWRIDALIQSGGMGSVFEAVRLGEGFAQRAALKLVRLGFESPELIARFARERQLLARVDHPNIARLLDGGTTDDGLPWLAMDYVDGLPIDTYADHRRLSLVQRLALFDQVADAIASLHQILITHRDIKMSNVLVDKQGRAKVLDFGIASLLDETASPEATVERRISFGSAAPEQLRGEGISTATDVYGLGVLLYTLLAGVPPYRITTEMSAAEIEALICDVDPLPASIALRKAGQVADIAAMRRSSVARLAQALRGDLDTILAKALHKDPLRRYGSVADLRADLQRYQQRRPIVARGDSRAYRVNRFIRRHWKGLLATAAVISSLAVGLGVALWQADEARQQRDRAQAMNSFMQEVLAEADPYAADQDRTVREVLTDASALLDERFVSQPLLEASLRQSVGGVQLTLLDLDGGERNLRRAQALLEETVAADAEVLLRTRAHLAWLEYERENYDRSRAAYLDVIADFTPAHNAEFRALIHNDLGVVLVGMELWQEAIDHQTAAMRLSPESPDRTATLINLGHAYDGLGELEQARRYYLQAIERLRALGERGVIADLAHALNNYGNVLSQKGRNDEALPLYLESLEVRRQVFGPDSDSVASQHLNVGRLLLDMHRPQDAVGHLAAAVRIFPRYRDESSIYLRVGRMSQARAVLLVSEDPQERAAAIATLETVVAAFDEDGDMRESRFMDQARAWLADARR